LLGKPAVGHAPQPFRMEREPRDRYALLFAMKSNQELRAILGWSYKRIHTRCRQLAGGKVRKQQSEWTLEEDRLLGTNLSPTRCWQGNLAVLPAAASSRSRCLKLRPNEFENGIEKIDPSNLKLIAVELME